MLIHMWRQREKKLKSAPVVTEEKSKDKETKQQ